MKTLKKIKNEIEEIRDTKRKLENSSLPESEKEKISKELKLILSFSCGQKQEKVERYMEDGAEVIVNHLEPYKIRGEPSTLHLDEEFTVNLCTSFLVPLSSSILLYDNNLG